MQWVVGDKLEWYGLGLCGTSVMLMWLVLVGGNFVQRYPAYGFSIQFKALILTLLNENKFHL